MLKRLLYFIGLLSFTLPILLYDAKLLQADDTLQQTSIIDILGLEGERLERYKTATERIKSHMLDPVPGEYPVTFFDDTDIPVIFSAHTKNSVSGRNFPRWINDRYIVYNALTEDYRISPRAIIILDVQTGKFRKFDEGPTEKTYSGLCYYPKTQRFTYLRSVPKSLNKYGHIQYYGHFNENAEFIEEFNSKTHPETKGLYLTNCEPSYGIRPTHPAFHPDDGMMIVKHTSVHHKLPNSTLTVRSKFQPGKLTWQKPDGTKGEIDINWRVTHPPYPTFDRNSERYFLATGTSKEDGSRQVFWFDRQFNLVDQYTLPPMNMENSAHTMLRSPVSNGFVTPCSHAGLERDEPGVLDLWGKQQKSYLCLVTREQKIIRILEGSVSDLAVSPNGCRVFGLWKPYMRADTSTGKNFIAEVCPSKK